MGKLIKAMALNDQVRIYICDSSDIVAQAQRRHALWPTASAALGRVLSMSAMLGSNLKSSKEKITVTINGGGPIGTIMADADYLGNVRGFVANPEVHYEYNDTKKLAVGIAVGTNGYLEVKKDLGLKEDFGGKVALQTGEIGDDFAYYFALSEQTPSIVSLGVLVDKDGSILASGGLLIQLLPNASEEVIDQVETISKQLKPMIEHLHRGDSLTTILQTYFKDVKVLEARDIAFKCNCSKDKMAAAIATIEDKEIEAMINEDHGCEITCNFCNEHYQFSEIELQTILEHKHENKKCGVA